MSLDMVLQNQIVVTASRLHEKALSFGGRGALTFFMTKYLRSRSPQIRVVWQRSAHGLIDDLVEHPNSSAIDLVRCLDAQFATQPKKELRQHPGMRSRYDLNGPFRLLPANSRLEDWFYSIMT
ncbi:hypothetical protein FS837_001698 [Tulasnella sp. UAMH 9824]|nr:hypothetical protein FS837_001698 [Tulasnella sp. UAMH 9824]